VRSGQRPYVSFDTLNRENLDAVLRSHGIGPDVLPRAGLESLARAWHFLPPWPDSVEGIGQLKLSFIVGPLSNGNTALLLDMAKTAGLPWDVIFGSDISQEYKPTPDAYRKPAAILGLDPGEVMLAAAHNDDLAGARSAGLATAFVARPTEHGPHQARDLAPAHNWDLAAKSITELAGQLQVKTNDL
jgi:2-haloacid dehalogenase